MTSEKIAPRAPPHKEHRLKHRAKGHQGQCHRNPGQHRSQQLREQKGHQKVMERHCGVSTHPGPGPSSWKKTAVPVRSRGSWPRVQAGAEQSSSVRHTVCLLFPWDCLQDRGKVPVFASRDSELRVKLLTRQRKSRQPLEPKSKLRHRAQCQRSWRKS